MSISTSVSELDTDLDEHASPYQRHSDQSNPVTFPPDLDLKTLRMIVSQDYGSSDIEYESEGSDREARDFTSDPEPDSEGQLSDQVNLKLPVGIAIKKYCFPEANVSFNLYAPFRHCIDYQLARFFSSVKISSAKIHNFFKDGILKDLLFFFFFLKSTFNIPPYVEHTHDGGPHYSRLSTQRGRLTGQTLAKENRQRKTTTTTVTILLHQAQYNNAPKG